MPIQGAGARKELRCSCGWSSGFGHLFGSCGGQSVQSSSWVWGRWDIVGFDVPRGTCFVPGWGRICRGA